MLGPEGEDEDPALRRYPQRDLFNVVFPREGFPHQRQDAAFVDVEVAAVNIVMREFFCQGEIVQGSEVCFLDEAYVSHTHEVT